MDALVFVLAVLGFLACLRLVLHAAFRLLRRGVDVFLSGEMSAAHARRGDLTAVQAAEGARSLARRARRFDLVRLTLTIGLLIAPLFTPWPQYVFAAYAPLWLLYRRRTAMVLGK
jgi:hypothetical protein